MQKNRNEHLVYFLYKSGNMRMAFQNQSTKNLINEKTEKGFASTTQRMLDSCTTAAYQIKTIQKNLFPYLRSES